MKSDILNKNILEAFKYISSFFKLRRGNFNDKTIEDFAEKIILDVLKIKYGKEYFDCNEKYDNLRFPAIDLCNADIKEAYQITITKIDENGGDNNRNSKINKTIEGVKKQKEILRFDCFKELNRVIIHFFDFDKVPKNGQKIEVEDVTYIPQNLSKFIEKIKGEYSTKEKQEILYYLKQEFGFLENHLNNFNNSPFARFTVTSVNEEVNKYMESGENRNIITNTVVLKNIKEIDYKKGYRAKEEEREKFIVKVEEVARVEQIEELDGIYNYEEKPDGIIVEFEDGSNHYLKEEILTENQEQEEYRIQELIEQIKNYTEIYQIEGLKDNDLVSDIDLSEEWSDDYKNTFPIKEWEIYFLNGSNYFISQRTLSENRQDNEDYDNDYDNEDYDNEDDFLDELKDTLDTDEEGVYNQCF